MHPGLLFSAVVFFAGEIFTLVSGCWSPADLGDNILIFRLVNLIFSALYLSLPIVALLGKLQHFSILFWITTFTVLFGIDQEKHQTLFYLPYIIMLQLGDFLFVIRKMPIIYSR